MFNVSQLYSIPQFLRANFHYVDYNKLALTSMKEKKEILDSSITFPIEY